MKPVEHIEKSDIDGASRFDLYHYRSSAQQLHKKWFQNPSKPDCTEEVFLRKYGMVVDGMDEQGLTYEPGDIDAALFQLRIKDSDPPAASNDDASKFVKFKGLEALKKGDSLERIVYGVVYEPDVKDSQGDWMTEEEIIAAAYSFMENGQITKLNHKGSAVASNVLQTFLAPVDFRILGELVTKGSWVLAERVLDDETWEKIEKGEITGFSMAGEGTRNTDSEPE